MKNRSWADWLDEVKKQVRSQKGLAQARAGFVKAARKTSKLPLVKRVYRYADVGRHRTWLDGRAKPIQDPAQTIFALAMSDHAANHLLATELPMLAAAARLTGEPALIRRVVAQLEEMASWSPLQRPGWCAYGGRLPPDGKDGNWLATGTGVRAIADTLEIMGSENLPPAIVARLHQLLAAEIVSIVDDWTVKRPWFVKRPMPLTNQWVLPTEGLIRACLVLGRERHAVSYEQGVANLFAHLDTHGDQGAFEEGIHYADFTVQSLMATARAMALAGDRRALEHPFLARFPLWALQHFQPGGLFINAFDAFAAARGNRDLLRNTFALASVCLGSRDALWALDHLAGGPEESLAGLVSRIMPRREGRPPRHYGAYTRAARVNWRSSWEPDATGVWVRGGHATDTHDHVDRGHVNLVLGGTPVFIEAGTPSYHNPRIRRDYASGRGHNVLQLGADPAPELEAFSTVPAGWQKTGALAPIAVSRLDGKGGDIEVDGSAGYEGLKEWRRRVKWAVGRLEVEDTVGLEPGRPKVVLFRWHLGVTRPPRLRASSRGVTLGWGTVSVRIEADCPIEASFEPMPDHTLQFRKWDDPRPDHLHVCLVVRTAEPVERFSLKTIASSRA